MTAPVQTTPTDMAENVHIWKNAEVYLALPDVDDPKAEADGTFGDDWLQVGILADGSSIGQERDADRNEIYGWGSKLITTDQKFKKDSRKFTTLEDNDATYSLAWPNSTRPTPGNPQPVLAPVDAVRHIGFRTTDQHGNVHVEVSRLPANVYPSSMDKADDGASSTEFTAEIREDSTGSLYDKAVFDATTGAQVKPDVIRFKTAGAGGSGN